MWLINTSTLLLENFLAPPQGYAILSHRWGSEEVSFQEWQGDKSPIQHREGYHKIRNACKQARADGHLYLWVDTNCIDKSSSAELSEAINSMFSYYRGSAICYAYLVDVPPCTIDESRQPASRFWTSDWFTRGWTLQELLAPNDLLFLSQDWSPIATKQDLCCEIAQITGIKKEYINDQVALHDASIAIRMSWMSNRVTSRAEDAAYCLMGIFNVNMPLLYGEGVRAFVRLQEELLKIDVDQTIFAWSNLQRRLESDDGYPARRASYLTKSRYVLESQYRPGRDSQSIMAPSLLAPDPICFYSSDVFIRDFRAESTYESPYMITSLGLSITLPLLKAELSDDIYLAVLAVRCTSSAARPALFLRCLRGKIFIRTLNIGLIELDKSTIRSSFKNTDIFIRRTQYESFTSLFTPGNADTVSGVWAFYSGESALSVLPYDGFPIDWSRRQDNFRGSVGNSNPFQGVPSGFVLKISRIGQASSSFLLVAAEGAGLCWQCRWLEPVQVEARSLERLYNVAGKPQTLREVLMRYKGVSQQLASVGTTFSARLELEGKLWEMSRPGNHMRFLRISDASNVERARKG
jgi:hypothetical protein